MSEMRVDRDGRVVIGTEPVGWVDHYDASKPRRVSRTWRAVKEGGRTRSGFHTRAEAVAWLVAA